METAMTKVEIIEELFEGDSGYVNNPKSRAIQHTGECNYRTDDGRRCAVGKCMHNQAIGKYGKFVGSVGNLATKIGEDLGNMDDIVLDSVLFKKYRGHEPQFWDDLQMLHDGQGYWYVGSINSRGLDKLAELKDKWA